MGTISLERLVTLDFDSLLQFCPEAGQVPANSQGYWVFNIVHIGGIST